MESKTATSVEDYSVPKEAENIFKNGILNNPLISKDLPAEFERYAEKVKFTGSDFPSIPINWRFAESISALKGLEAVFLEALLDKKYNIPPQDIEIDTDHASLFIMSSLLWQIDPHGTPLSTATFMVGEGKARFDKMMRNCDIYNSVGDIYRTLATNIYKTKDGRFFHLHSSLNPAPTMDAIGVPHTSNAKTFEDAVATFIEAVGKIDSQEMQRLATNVYKQAGTICWSIDEYKNSEHGKSNADVGLYELYAKPSSAQPASWWPSVPQTSTKRPLAGLKVVDLTRIIAAPAVTRSLAEYGASVMRITADHLPDFSSLHPDLNWGKWNASLDLRKEEERAKLKSLILDADVVVSGYRPGVMEKYGFGCEDILEMCKDRKRGIIVARENCYGWHGPWASRSGWQQISDANVGVSLEFGRAMGNEEAVTPVFPNSDYCTGVAGFCGIVDAILRRGAAGGSYQVDIALNYYSQWLVNSVGVYPPAVWEALWTKNGRKVFRHYEGMTRMLPQVMAAMFKNSAAKLFKPAYFTEAEAPLGEGGEPITMKIVRPVLKFTGNGGEKPELGFNVGTRGNGVDQPRWPEDLLISIVR